MEEKNISLSEAIIDFVETWDLVLEAKKEEYKKKKSGKSDFFSFNLNI